MRLMTASGTDPGLVRSSNEDAVFDFVRSDELGEPLGLLIVADGMGGHLAGEVASQMAVEAIFEGLQDHLHRDDSDDTRPVSRAGAETPETLVDGRSRYLMHRLEAVINDANLAIHDYALKHPSEAGNLGTTVACTLIKGDLAFVANVGDSRVYLLREGQLHQLTEDHSLVHHLVQNGQIEPDELYDHPHRSIITRALGYNPDVKVDMVSQRLKARDKVLICSDGLWEMVRDQEEIARCLLEAADLPGAVSALIEAARQGGGADNIGVAVGELIVDG
jgi:protein phosphatase